jgi:hypothetical protein
MAKLPESFRIQTIPGYRTGDGSQFHSLNEAQIHTRRHLLGRIYDDACAARPEFAKLDRDLFIDISYAHGSKMGITMDDPLQPHDPNVVAQPAAKAVMPAASSLRTAAEQTRSTLDQALRSMPRASVNDPLPDREAAAIAARFRPRDTEETPIMDVDESALARELGRAAI